MSWLSNLIGGSVAEPITAVGNIIDKLYTTEGEKLDKQTLYERIKQQPALAQAAINKKEAEHRSIFVAGWRPFIGWVCGVCLAVHFIPVSIAETCIWIKLCITHKTLVACPTCGNDLTALVTSLLGFGLYRTAEKLNNKTF